MLLMIEKDIRGGICNVMHRYAKINNKYMKGCYPSTEQSYLMYWNVNNLCGLAMSQKLPVDGFKWENRSLDSGRYSYRTMMMTVTKVTSLS